jgi:hypothetical protein
LQGRNVTLRSRHNGHSAATPAQASTQAERRLQCTRTPNSKSEVIRMEAKSKWIIAAVFVSFAILNVITLAEDGMQGLIHLLESRNLWAYALMVDLAISLGLIISWMIADARAKGRNSLPYVVLTIALGSIGPLLYLLGGKTRPGTRAIAESTSVR